MSFLLPRFTRRAEVRMRFSNFRSYLSNGTDGFQLLFIIWSSNYVGSRFRILHIWHFTVLTCLAYANNATTVYSYRGNGKMLLISKKSFFLSILLRDLRNCELLALVLVIPSNPRSNQIDIEGGILTAVFYCRIYSDKSSAPCVLTLYPNRIWGKVGSP